MRESEIIEAIEAKIGRLKLSYAVWTIGITDDPQRRKGEHNNPPLWDDWEADTETIARDVEKHFLEKGMKGAPGGGDHPNFVYVF